MEGTTQHKAVRTDNRNRIYLYIALAILALAVVFLLLKLLMGKREINARLLRNEIFLNENLVYTDNTPGSAEWKWEFGDGSRSKEQSGYYRFKESGTYLVRLTVDNSLQQQFAVVVKDTVPLSGMDSIRISGPTAGVTGMQLRLEADGDANLFEWSFGETGRVDAKGRNAYYTYRTPGRYTVALKTDRSPVPVYTVLNITEPLTDIGLVDPNAGGDYAEKISRRREPFVLKGYFGKVDLPLLLDSKWEEEYELRHHRYSLENKAVLDTGQFDRKAFARMLKDLTGVFNINAALEVDMEERFDYNGGHWLTEAELFLETKVSDWYGITSAHTLSQVTEGEADHPERLFFAEAGT